MFGGSSLSVGCENVKLEKCKALIVSKANALAIKSVVKTLMPPGSESGTRGKRVLCQSSLLKKQGASVRVNKPANGR